MDGELRLGAMKQVVVDLVGASADDVRARFARLLAPSATASSALGSISLQSHQLAALSRIHAAMREFGGALLADETGLGKTFVALAVARDADRPVVVAPAGLKGMWHDAAHGAGVDVSFVSIEALSRGATPPVADPDLVVIDEAHHLRNPVTARYRAVARLTEHARVLLLSATPVHNSADDVIALLALFLGGRAAALDASWTSRCIIRRSRIDMPDTAMPRVLPPVPLGIDHDEHTLDAILALPPPVPPADGGDGGALVTYSLLRQWASSRAALTESLQRRLARATAMLSALDAGRHPSASELAAWSFVEGSVQLAFPELVVADERRTESAEALGRAVRDHSAAIRSLLHDLASATDPDVRRAAQLAAVRRRHHDERIVAFSQYAATVEAMYRELRNHAGIASLTAEGGRVAGGSLSRREVLERFSPRTHGVRAPRRAEAVELLLTTDLLSEGVNLQDASVVVHLDMPWTPARLDQRVGRVARLGSGHEQVAVYAMLPPAAAERIVRVEERLRGKLRVAARTVGVVGTIVPSLLPASLAGEPDVGERSASDESPARTAELIRTHLARWRHMAPCTTRADTPLVASVRSTIEGFVAVVGESAAARLVADIGTGPTDDPRIVLAALREADGADTDLDPGALRAATAALGRWHAATRTRRDMSLDGALRARARRSVIDRISTITRRAPRHLRSVITALAAGARRTVTERYGVGAERVLEELAGASMPDEAWLRAVSTFGSIHGSKDDSPGGMSVLALLLLSPP